MTEQKEASATQPLYPLRVAAELSLTSVYSIRQYIDRGLIIPYRTSTNRHLFSNVDIARLRCIRKNLDENGLNLAGIKSQFAMTPCWLIRGCSEEDRNVCDAYDSVTDPCWTAANKGPECVNTDCRTCAVYKLPEKCENLKDLLKKIDRLIL
ncbi:MAG: MerR family transcriptional regulator [Candidatus Delongbacteria bacterium]|nr:MerR family transcriptional regulator [Candidatus Delongbacteria bacterium]